MAAYPPEVAGLIDDLLAGVRGALGDNLLGVYLRGSLAIGDFNPETSDVDVLIVTHRPVCETEFEALLRMHDRLRALPNRYAAGLEAAYIDAAAAGRFVTGQRHPTITSHDPFRWESFGSNWVLDLWMAREHSPALYGPDPRSVFGAVSEVELRRSATQRLQEWAKWAAHVPDEDKAWLDERTHQAYVVETVCRGLHTAEFGTVPTKRQAVGWALAALPQQWRSLIEWSQKHRTDEASDPGMIPELADFLRWAAAKADANPP